MSYLDLASESLHSGPSGLVSGYWSPLYPELISVAMAIFHPTPSQEFPLVHFVNFLIFGFTLWAFHFFLRRWLPLIDDSNPADEEKRKFVIAFAFSTFLFFTVEFIGLGIATPDLLVAGITFLTAGTVCRLSLPGANWKHYAALGFACGLGYYAKSAMFPLGLVLLGGLFFWPPSRGVTRRRLLVSIFVFMLTVAPLVTLVSKHVGHLSFGEVGKLSYAWYANGLQLATGWTGDSSNIHGTPEHPPRTLMRSPLILEFDSPIKGTYPLWYDASYWYAGAKLHFDLHRQIAALRVTIRHYLKLSSEMPEFFLGALVLCILAIREKRFPHLRLRERWLMIWPIAALLMFSLVWVEGRYVSGFFVLLWLGICGELMFRVNRRFAAVVCALVVGAVMIALAVDLPRARTIAEKELSNSSARLDYQTVGSTLTKLGLKSGDRIAVVGGAFDAYYARYDGLRITAQIPVEAEFWKLNTVELEAVEDRLGRIGVKAIVAKGRPNVAAPANWQDVPVSDSTRYSVLRLPQQLPK